MEDSFEQRQRLEKARKRVKSITGFYKHLIIYLLINGFLLIMKAINLDPGGRILDVVNIHYCRLVGIRAHSSRYFCFRPQCLP